MNRNESNGDRLARAVAAAALVAVSAWIGVPTVPGVVLLAVAAVLAVTAVVGFCPLYRLLNIRTGPRSVTSAKPRA